jgi:hypothetical protein
MCIINVDGLTHLAPALRHTPFTRQMKHQIETVATLLETHYQDAQALCNHEICVPQPDVVQQQRQ